MTTSLSDQLQPSTPADTDVERRQRIAETAYFIAERRGFSGEGDHTFSDWLKAESIIDKLDGK